MLAIWSLVLLSFLKPAWTSGSSRLTYYWSLAWKILSITLAAHEPKISRCTGWIYKRQRNQRSNCQHLLWHRKSKRIPENIHFCFIDYAKSFDCVDHNQLWKIPEVTGMLGHRICLLRNLYASQEVTEPDMKQRMGSILGKDYFEAVYCHPASLTYMQSTSWEILGWKKHKL